MKIRILKDEKFFSFLFFSSSIIIAFKERSFDPDFYLQRDTSVSRSHKTRKAVQVYRSTNKASYRAVCLRKVTLRHAYFIFEKSFDMEISPMQKFRLKKTRRIKPVEKLCVDVSRSINVQSIIDVNEKLKNTKLERQK